MTTETTVTYSADETSNAVSYVGAIVREARTRAEIKRAAEADEERLRAEEKEQERANLEEMVRASLPEHIRAFISVHGYNWKYRAIVSLPDCAPFGIDIHAGALTRLFYPATCYDGDGGQYEPYLEISSSGTYSTLEDEIARAYEAQRTYNNALAIYTLTKAEREHANAMSERESALRHEEEPEPSDEILPICNQPATLSDKTCEEIMQMAEKCIAKADTETEGIERYLLLRAQTLCAYVSARAIHA